MPYKPMLPVLRHNLTLFRNYSQGKNNLFYITTPIFYVNACPHIGHLYSAVISDCLFRYQKLRKSAAKYIFSTGTDEHGTKVEQAAKQHGQPVERYCTTIAGEYKALFDDTDVRYTHFNRTTDKERHLPAVEHFWNSLQSKDLIYKANYSGWYCVSDETFLTESQLMENDKKQKVSIESGHPVQWTEEENYMFKLSKFQDDIIYWIKQSDRIKPKKFEKTLLGYLDEPLRDISVSRPATRVPWGINVPSDNMHTIYVWMDALINYLTSAGYPDKNFTENWPPSLQVIGKDILKFHGIYWPAFLIAAGLQPPNQLLVHSHWTVDGRKMSKSKHNVIDPNVVSQKYTYEGLRYFLLAEGTPHSDGNYSDTKATLKLNNELSNVLGNLLSRICGNIVNAKQIIPKLNQEELQQILKEEVTQELIGLVKALPNTCAEHYESYNIYLAIDSVIKVLRTTNKFVEVFEPWELRKNPDQTEKLNTVLRISFEVLRVCGIILQPIIPEMSGKVLDKLNVNENERYWDNLDFVLDPLCEGRKLGANRSLIFKRIKV